MLLGGAPRPSAGSGLDPGLASLKTRPLEIALCFLAGDTDQEIASSLHISCSTVRRNLRSTMRALGLADREALRRAYARGDASKVSVVARLAPLLLEAGSPQGGAKRRCFPR